MTGSQQLILAEGAGGAVAANYIEDVFSTWLYTGNGSTQTITNGIDLSTKGGLVWCKYRNVAGQSHGLFDTARGASNVIYSNLTNAQASESGVTAFNTTGFSLGSNSGYNANNGLFVSWTFRKQPKFFDVVTYTGDGSATRRNISHNLGSVPGCIIVKRTDSTGTWWVYHRANSYGSEYSFELNATTAGNSYVGLCDVAPTSTTFPVNSVGGTQYVNINGATYVAYLFAHDAGGFGLTGTDNVISCGSFTTDASSNATVTLGYEPQWILFKRTNGTGNWYLVDNMRAWNQTQYRYLFTQSSAAEGEETGNYAFPTSTGFQFNNSPGSLVANAPYIYIAIRRGPMKTPTTGTSVFTPAFASSSGTYTAVAGFPVDLDLYKDKSGSTGFTWDRLRGSSVYLQTTSTAAEVSDTNGRFDSNTSFIYNTSGNFSSYINWMFRRAPGFFDVVCYTGTGSATTQAHNLGVVPELMILKPRSNGSNGWCVYSATVGNTGRLLLDTSDAAITGYSVFWNSTTPTSTVFSLGTAALTNQSATTFVAYLFASCPGVSKVGSYTGTGALQTVNCGFTSGARFVLIKRTDSTGDWYVYDSTRGITSGNDPYLFLNTTAAEVTNTNYVDTTSVGFQVTAAAPAGLNASGGTYIFLAIA